MAKCSVPGAISTVSPGCSVRVSDSTVYSTSPFTKCNISIKGCRCL